MSSSLGASGRWAGEQFLRALNAGQPISPQVLRTLDTLRKDEWKHLDEALVEEGVIRLRGIADLIAAGLTIPVPNAMGKTLVEFETITDMNDADVSLGGVGGTEDDRVDFALDGIPLPITHKDFKLNLRTLTASRMRGESLDTTQARIAGRKVAEKLEHMLFNGGKTFGGKTIYGYTTHPNINTQDFENNEAWDNASKDGAGILTDVLAALTKLKADRFYGPYWVYIPSTYDVTLSNDFKANSDLTIRQRLLLVDGIARVTTADQLADGNIVVVQATRDVVALVDGENLQTVQWDIEGGFVVKFKAFAIQVPLIRADVAGRCGVCIIKQL
jgi:uncharacterized linocin/CFP29 family protein